MALIVEDGSGNPDADSLVTLEEVRAFAQSRGATVSGDDTILEPQVRSAHDYLLANEGRMQGSRAVAGQGLPYPRKCVQLFGTDLDPTVIPACLKKGVCQLVIEALTPGLDPMASFDGKIVLSETVGPLATTYANSGLAGEPNLPRVDALLSPIYSNLGALLRTQRV